MDFSVIPDYFRFVAPLLGISFIISMIIFPFYIKALKKLQWGQQIREEGPEDHLSKKGTPTMGGLAIIVVFVLTSLCLPFIPSTYDGKPLHLTPDYFVFAGIILVNAGLGFVDDFLKIKKSKSLGLRARDKMAVHLILAIATAYYMINFTEIGSKIFIPFLGHSIEFGWWLYPFFMLVLPGCVNAVNLTDGLDGLAGINIIISLCAFSLILLVMGRIDMVTGGIIIAGALMAFLWFNCYPAKIFMGDTGSLALGGAIAGMAILTGTELILCIIGGIYVCEALSVMIQVTYFKITKKQDGVGKRIFRMTPIHHHFEKGGMHEVQVTIRFAITSFMFAVLGLYAYFGF